jgi:excisionase family DNA binding protein
MADLTTPQAANPPPMQLMDVTTIAALLGCSPRHVYRLSETGLMPRPVRLGDLVRWRRVKIEEWIDGGYKPCGFEIVN